MMPDDWDTFFGDPDDDGQLVRIGPSLYIRKHEAHSRKRIEDLDADGISTQSNDEYPDE